MKVKKVNLNSKKMVLVALSPDVCARFAQLHALSDAEGCKYLLRDLGFDFDNFNFAMVDFVIFLNKY